MNKFSAKKIKGILKEIEAQPLKGLGQNFLINQKILAEIVESAQLSKKDIVLEVGAGIGNLTLVLAPKVKKVIAFEIDKKLFKILQKNTKKLKNVEIFNKDIRKVDLEKFFKHKTFKVVANIPYYLTSFLLRKLFSLQNKPRLILLLVQKELGERIMACPPKMNLLALSVQLFSKPKIVKKVKKGNFWPTPKVDSVLILLKTKKETKKLEANFLLRLAKIGFSGKRKMLKNNLKKGLKLNEQEVLETFKKAGIRKNSRAEELALKNWQKLAIFTKNK